jgi:hydroxymethylglutaryl-CoA lyase
MNKSVTLIECPRDAMQGWLHFIPTEKKIAYINQLLQVGFDTIDFGSFVSPKAIPQMADTKEVIEKLSFENTNTKLLAIVANLRGAEDAMNYAMIDYLGFPFSVSPTFQQRNANSSIEESLHRVDDIQALCVKHNKELVVYLSMAFGNPYGDDYNEEILLRWADEMVKRNVQIISLADTVGVAQPAQVAAALNALIPAYSNTIFGVHLHSTAFNREEKLQAAIDAGCTRFDGALKGIGGCPMAQDELVGNMQTEWMIDFFAKHNVSLQLNKEALGKALEQASEIFV